MVPMNKQILSYIAQFVELDDAEKAHLLSILKPRKFLKRQFLLQAGDECRYETYVVSGCLKAYFVDADGNSHVVQFAVDDWWISDMDSLTNSTPSTLNIDAVEDTEVLQIEKKDFHELFIKIPKFNTLYRMMLMKAFIAHQRRIVDNLCKPAKERYLDFIQKYRDIEQRVPQHQIASYLGMTPEFLSQIRRKLADRS